MNLRKCIGRTLILAAVLGATLALVGCGEESTEVPTGAVIEGEPMVKTLNKVGNSLALILDKSILELHQVTRDTPIGILSDGQNILLVPQRKYNGKKIHMNKFKPVPRTKRGGRTK